jgi:hypothetical protein
MKTIADALEASSQIESNLFKYQNLLIATDPAEETDWLMVSTDSGGDWECYPPTTEITSII